MYKLLILLLFAFGCGRPGWGPKQIIPDTIYVSDTIYLPADTSYYISQMDSLKDELFIARYKIERVKYYLDIVDRNPSQIKFLKGWVRRAVK